MNVDITSRALLVSLRLSTWSARKYDKRVTKQVLDAHSAGDEAGRFNKSLLPADAASYKALTSYITSVRHRHYELTLPWGDEWTRLLPIANHAKYLELQTEAESKLEELREAFVSDYPDLKANARRYLNGMYNEEDYPSIADIGLKFQIAFAITGVPTSDFRVSLPEAVLSTLRSQLNDRVAENTRTAMDDAWQRLHDCVDRLAERLRTPDAIFRDSLLGNVRDICDLLPGFNLTNDPQLERLRQDTLKKLTPYSPDTLRTDERVRAQVAQSADSILQAIRGQRRIKIATAA